MDIVLFQEITTDKALTKLEAEGKKYAGLYVDMNVAEERKYVKENAALINDLLKTLDRARIDKAKAYKASVESEAKAIRERLEAANLPFTMLIDAHKAERAEILAAEKAKAEAAALVLQIEADHEHAIMMDKIETIEKAEREQERIAYEKRIADEAAQKAVEQERYIQQANANRIEQENRKREANRQHVSAVHKAAKEALMKHAGLDEEVAKCVVMCIHNKFIDDVTINY